MSVVTACFWLFAPGIDHILDKSCFLNSKCDTAQKALLENIFYGII